MCDCHKCNDKCKKPDPELIEQMTEFMLQAENVRDALESIGEFKLAHWDNLTNYLARKCVFQ